MNHMLHTADHYISAAYTMLIPKEGTDSPYFVCTNVAQAIKAFAHDRYLCGDVPNYGFAYVGEAIQALVMSKDKRLYSNVQILSDNYDTIVEWDDCLSSATFTVDCAIVNTVRDAVKELIMNCMDA